MKITAFAGSSSTQSINKQLVNYVLKQFAEHEVKLIDLNDFEMPIFSVDREKNGYPEKAQKFRNELAQSDCIICSMAEHNGSYTVAFKNILDWCSRIDIKVFANKPMLLMSTSPGGFGGGNVMNLAKTQFPKCGAQIIETFSLPSFSKNFINGSLVIKELENELNSKIETFKSRLT